jgi:MATE family multidrug resistance protein
MVNPIMFALISANIVNLIGDWALIYGHLGFPAMGIIGSVGRRAWHVFT